MRGVRTVPGRDLRLCLKIGLGGGGRGGEKISSSTTQGKKKVFGRWDRGTPHPALDCRWGK